MAKAEMAIFTNMCMIYDGQGNILVQDRKNPDWPGVTFPGGHVEPGESFVGSVVREVKEETGLDIDNPVLCGTKQFLLEDGTRYVVLLFKTNRFHGSLRSSSEGEVFWLPKAELGKHTLAHEFDQMLKVFESDELSEFYYYKDNGTWKPRLM